MSEQLFEAPESLKKIKKIILVLSGKGGVGKSSVTTQLALSLVLKGNKVGVLDIDLTGPSIPRMFGVESKQILQADNGWLPVSVDGTDNRLLVVLIGFLINDRGNAIAWRGPRKTSMINQFISNVIWPDDLDYLIIDTPPGTSDEHISIAELLRMAKPTGAVIVTTPQQVAINDVKKEINFCKKVHFKILGIIENMSGFVCPYCAECSDLFSKGGGQKLAHDVKVPYLGNLPIDPKFVEMIEENNHEQIEESNHKQIEENSHECSASSLPEKYSISSIKPLFDVILDNLLTQNLPSRI